MIQSDENIFQRGWFNHQPVENWGISKFHCHLLQQTTAFSPWKVLSPGKALAWNGFLATNGGLPAGWRGWRCPQYLRPRKTTPQKFNSSPLKIGIPKRKLVFQPSFFRGYVNFRGCNSCNMSSESQWLVQMYFLLKFSSLFRGHVSFQGCTTFTENLECLSGDFLTDSKPWDKSAFFTTILGNTTFTFYTTTVSKQISIKQTTKYSTCTNWCLEQIRFLLK